MFAGQISQDDLKLYEGRNCRLAYTAYLPSESSGGKGGGQGHPCSTKQLSREGAEGETQMGK